MLALTNLLDTCAWVFCCSSSLFNLPGFMPGVTDESKLDHDVISRRQANCYGLLTSDSVLSRTLCPGTCDQTCCLAEACKIPSREGVWMYGVTIPCSVTVWAAATRI